MPYLDSLSARGLISADAMANLVQRIGDLKKPQMWEGGGAGARGVYTPRGYGETFNGPSPANVAPLQREAIASGRSGRPTQTKPLPIGSEDKILERAEQRLEEGPRVIADKAQREAILRENWEKHGRERDFDFDNYRTWDREVVAWNKTHPDNLMPEGDYTFGSNPEFERAFEEKHLSGKKQPYPGATKANEYFESDPDSMKHTVYKSPRQIPDDYRPGPMQK